MIKKELSPLKLSIIIPVYNVEPYVEKCLRSCAEQDIPCSDYEIIVVNDGTKDNSLAIIKRIAKEYSNIKFVSQENAGLSAARNKGFSLAIGEYIWFVDSDDWIETNCLKKITDSLYENHLVGLMICAADVVNGTPIKRHDYSKLKRDIYSGIELLKMNYWSPCVQFTIYKRDFIRENNLKFMEGIFHEDSEFTPRSYYFIKRIAIINDVIYFKFMNPCSITRSVNHKKAFDCIKVAKSLSIFSQILPADLMYIYNKFISININNSLYNAYQMDIVTIRNLNTDLKKNKFIFKHLRQSTIVKYRLEGILFGIFPRHCVQIYKCMQLMNKNHYK
jgi:glycosyltransferase involved in cell wall biosynthesis